MDYKIKIEAPVQTYYEDIVICKKKKPMTLNALERVFCNIEMKRIVSVAWKTLVIKDLVETLLYIILLATG